jgi:hypothetical protein
VECIRTVEKLALKFRLTIESLPDKDFGEAEWFLRFPRGCCGETSELLSKYLMENGVKTEYVWGVHGNQSHAWLEYNSYVIDITADQFSDIKDRVVIKADKQWYSKFKRQSRKYSDFEIDNELNKVRLGTLYKNIISRINA